MSTPLAGLGPRLPPPDALRLLVLGSFPGERSLLDRQYYAHPRNAFWPLMGELLGFDPDLAYEARVEALNAAGIGLWDVLQGCRRRGSLDSAIRDARPNPLPRLVAASPALRAIAFNGSAAANLFRRHVKAVDPRIALHTLPSTSPANAGLPREGKRAAWRGLLHAAGIA